MTKGRWFCVIWIETERIITITEDADQAAEMLQPGTTYGRGADGQLAQAAAIRSAHQLKWNQGTMQS